MTNLLNTVIRLKNYGVGFLLWSWRRSDLGMSESAAQESFGAPVEMLDESSIYPMRRYSWSGFDVVLVFVDGVVVCAWVEASEPIAKDKIDFFLSCFNNECNWELVGSDRMNPGFTFPVAGSYWLRDDKKAWARLGAYILGGVETYHLDFRSTYWEEKDKSRYGVFRLK